MAATLEGLRHQFAPAVKTLGETARFGASASTASSTSRGIHQRHGRLEERRAE
ncbi:MAG: hypothetical protein LBS31_10510 [Candidatus Adiutrix sp.]|jgi:hypothetical protein|nr:hypothetical protein [Candidatus Adiutrix sp.]